MNTTRTQNVTAAAIFTVLIAGGAAMNNAFSQAEPTEKVPAVVAGQTGFDPVDRLAIINLISAYSVQLDTFNLDAWFALFTDDAVFVVRDGGNQFELSGDKFRAEVRERFTAFQRTGNVRRHLISTTLFVEQTRDTAHTVSFGLLTNVKDGKTFSAVTNLNYEGWYVKRDGVWKIQRWIDAPSSPVD
jgi:3-phenylpropionate/cinnamic acid dioxygenase small subunit